MVACYVETMTVPRLRHCALALALAGCRAADDAPAPTDVSTTVDAGLDAPHDAASEQTGMVFEHCIDGVVVTSPYIGIQSTRCDVSVSGVACVAEGPCPVLCGPASCSDSCVCEKTQQCADHGADAPSCLQTWDGALDCSTGDLVATFPFGAALSCTSDGWAYFAGPADETPACDAEGTWAIAYTPN